MSWNGTLVSRRRGHPGGLEIRYSVRGLEIGGWVATSEMRGAIMKANPVSALWRYLWLLTLLGGASQDRLKER